MELCPKLPDFLLRLHEQFLQVVKLTLQLLYLFIGFA
jgi:hypothetical protein